MTDSLKRISEEYNVPISILKEAVRIEMNNSDRRRISKDIVPNCIYPGLRKWINEAFKNKKEYEMLFGGSECANSNRIKMMKKLKGEVNYNLREIMQHIEESGKTFEYLFLMTQEQVEQDDKENK